MDKKLKEEYKLLKTVLEDNGIIVKGEGRPRKIRRKENRERKIPKDRMCPKCRKVILKSRSWVLKDESNKMCRKCYFRENVGRQGGN